MKLLIITQKADINDGVLGFFHGWIKEFAKHCEKITVICLQKGEYDLPENVKIFSLGKEKRAFRLKYIFNFYKYIWRERKNYDSVFVHMNQEYVLLGGLFWKIFGKKIMMWRNHYAGSFLTDVSAFFCNTVFCTSRYSYTSKYKKTVLMPIGIDTEIFKKKNDIRKKKNSILFLARIAPSKKPELLIEALRILKSEGVQFTADLYGDAEPKDAPYLDSLKKKVKEYGLESLVFFKYGVPNNRTPEIYGSHMIFVNASPSGMYDKTIFEAMACETLVLTSNKNLKGEINDIFLFKEDDAHDLAQKLKTLLALDERTRNSYGARLRTFVADKQSLALLAHKLFASFSLKKYKRAILFQNGSIGDFLMAIFLAENLYRSGVVKEAIIFVPREERFLGGFVEAYPFIRVVRISRAAAVFMAVRCLSPKTLIVLPPTPGMLPLRAKFLAWAMSRFPGSFLVGFQDKGSFCHTLYSLALPYDTNKTFLETMQEMLGKLGADGAKNPDLRLIPAPETLGAYGAILPYIFFHPRGSSEKRSFTKEEAVNLIQSIFDAAPNAHILISGSLSEHDFLEVVALESGNRARISLVVDASARELATLIQGAKLFIGVDTGISHLASFLGVRTLCVAHNGTANWLPFYNPHTRVLYRLAEDTEAHEGREYLEARRKGELKPFGRVPESAIAKVVREMLGEED